MAIRVKARGNETAEQLVRRFKKMCEKEGLTKDVKKRMHYEKPSERKRRESRRFAPRPVGLLGSGPDSRTAGGRTGGGRTGGGRTGGGRTGGGRTGGARTGGAGRSSGPRTGGGGYASSGTGGGGYRSSGPSSR